MDMNFILAVLIGLGALSWAIGIEVRKDRHRRRVEQHYREYKSRNNEKPATETAKAETAEA